MISCPGFDHVAQNTIDTYMGLTIYRATSIFFRAVILRFVSVYTLHHRTSVWITQEEFLDDIPKIVEIISRFHLNPAAMFF